MSVNGASSSSPAASLVINGLISGISTQAVIQALLQSYQAPITNLQNEQTTLNSQASDYQTLNSDMQAILNAAQALNTPNTWNLMSATSSATSVATASASPGAQGGTLSFQVDALASGNLLLSSGSVGSTSATATTSQTGVISSGALALGFTSLSGGGLSLGSHTIEVTQASQAATVTASSPLAASTTITAGQNDTLSLQVNGGTAVNVVLAAGTYTQSGLVSAIDAAAQSAGAAVSASVDAAGVLSLQTTEQGSAATLNVTGGDALSSLGLSTASATGADAVVSVDGTATTLTSIQPGGSVTLNAPSGTLSATVQSAPSASGSLLSAGSAKAAEISTGSGSLNDLINAINASGVGATASAIQQANGSYRLQVAANSTGLAGAVTVDPSLLGGGSIGQMTTVTSAADAQVSVGGSAGYTVDSSTNTFTNLMPGTSITVASLGSSTVTVSPDAAGEATKVSSLVKAANQAVADLHSLAGYNETTKTAGPLMGSAVLENLQNQIGAIFASAAGTSGLGSARNVGISLNSDGSISFSQSTFEQAFSSNPTGVASLFTQDGSFQASATLPSAQASLVYAGEQTIAGAYAVTVSQSATQATDLGSVLSAGTTSAPETLTVTSGSSVATYQVNSGESLASIAAGLNGAFGTAGLALSAEVVNNGTQLQITSDAYGSAASFDVASSAPGTGTTGLGGATAGTAATFSGTDIAGTINGVAATGTGQVLAAPLSDPTLAGLSISVPTPGITTSTAIGTFTYSPGLAQQLAALADAASNAENGSLTTAAKGLTAESTGLNQQIAMYQSFEASQQSVLEKEFVKMEQALGQAKNQGAALQSQIAQLP